jgi:hypothetical protein
MSKPSPAPLTPRPLLARLLRRLREPRRFLQVLAGPRQVGKTTLARQAVEALGGPAVSASADSALLEDRSWIEQQWERGRLEAAKAGRSGALLVLDEIQKVPRWSDSVKRLWDEDTAAGTPLKVLLLGSAPLLLQRGLAESLAGRFEVIRAGHWSFPEMEAAFGWDLERWLYFGGYPGPASLVPEDLAPGKDGEDPVARWRLHVLDSLVETTLSRDILLLARVDKPALLRHLLGLGCEHSGEILSFHKMTGQLQDAGNTTTLAHYLDLLRGAGMLAGIRKYSGNRVRVRGSSPRLIALNTALMTASSGRSPAEVLADPEFRGRLVETTVGAHLLGTAEEGGFEVHYWLDRDREVDFVLSRGGRVAALEVKSGRKRRGAPGLEAFAKAHGKVRKFLVGEGGIPLEEFFRMNPLDLLR